MKQAQAWKESDHREQQRALSESSSMGDTPKVSLRICSLNRDPKDEEEVKSMCKDPVVGRGQAHREGREGTQAGCS